MPNTPFFPALPGLGWSVKKTPVFSSIVASHISGREVRARNYAAPLWNFELTIEGLSSDAASYPGLGAQSLQTLMGFYLQCAGQFGTFLYVDPSDNAVSGQPIGVGDGATTSFPLQRGLNGFMETVGCVTTLSSVTLNGAPASGWSLNAPNGVAFASAPASGATIAASFSFAFLCRFSDDTAEFEQIAQNLWMVKSLKFQSVRS